MCLDTLNHFKAGEEAGLWECHGEGRNQVKFCMALDWNNFAA